MTPEYSCETKVITNVSLMYMRIAAHIMLEMQILTNVHCVIELPLILFSGRGLPSNHLSGLVYIPFPKVFLVKCNTKYSILDMRKVQNV